MQAAGDFRKKNSHKGAMARKYLTQRREDAITRNIPTQRHKDTKAQRRDYDKDKAFLLPHDRK